MSEITTSGKIDWDGIRLVVFDVDGTLYDQRRLRLRMLREMLFFAVQNRDVSFIRMLRVYRERREQLGDAMIQDFERVLTSQTAAALKCSEIQVRAIVEEWIDRRPLRHLIGLRYPNLRELFRSLHRQGKMIGIFSDYPAQKKLDALELRADVVVCASDSDVGVLKPHPRGLHVLMERAQTAARDTILIGDRADRDGRAAQAANVRVLIRSPRKIPGWPTFATYSDAVFSRINLPV